MTTDKKPVALLAEILNQHGLDFLVHSPGSRNAPIIIAFSLLKKTKIITVADERSAAFFALGIAIESKKCVAIDCTSGSAPLNYAPAIAEAYYQKVPLLVLTADRSPKHIDIGDGQTIRQNNLYANFIKASFTLPAEAANKESVARVKEMIAEAYQLSMQAPKGPVHLNIPLDEPLYNLVDDQSAERPLLNIPTKNDPQTIVPDLLLRQWKESAKTMILVGQSTHKPELEKILRLLSNNKNTTVLTETTSNLHHPDFIDIIDSAVATIKPDETARFGPDLLITCGGAIVSKMIKAFLRKNKPTYHWHFSPNGEEMNTFFCQTGTVAGEENNLFERLSKIPVQNESSYRKSWFEKKSLAQRLRANFLSKTPYSDFKVFESILNSLPKPCNLHLGNSTPVRYSQLFGSLPQVTCYSNRGVSGIDGQISTAAGVSHLSPLHNVLITGDLGFIYDSNGLLLLTHSPNLKIIVINNQGGGIFRFIPGPDTVEGFEEYFEAKHNLRMNLLTRAFDVTYLKAETETQVVEGLKKLFNLTGKSAVLEIITPGTENARILRSYFQKLKENNVS